MPVSLAFLLLKHHYLGMKAKIIEPQNFESAMTQLEDLVIKIEAGNLSLEDSLKEFEKGIGLSRVCQKALVNAEQRVKILSTDGETEDEFTTELNE